MKWNNKMESWNGMKWNEREPERVSSWWDGSTDHDTISLFWTIRNTVAATTFIFKSPVTCFKFVCELHDVFSQRRREHWKKRVKRVRLPMRAARARLLRRGHPLVIGTRAVFASYFSGPPFYSCHPDDFREFFLINCTILCRAPNGIKITWVFL